MQHELLALFETISNTIAKEEKILLVGFGTFEVREHVARTGRNPLKDKKSGTMHVMYFYGFLLVQFGAIDLIWRGLAPGSHLPLGPIYPYFTFFQEIVVFMILFATAWGFYRRYSPLGRPRFKGFILNNPDVGPLP